MLISTRPTTNTYPPKKILVSGCSVPSSRVNRRATSDQPSPVPTCHIVKKASEKEPNSTCVSSHQTRPGKVVENTRVGPKHKRHSPKHKESARRASKFDRFIFSHGVDGNDCKYRGREQEQHQAVRHWDDRSEQGLDNTAERLEAFDDTDNSEDA